MPINKEYKRKKGVVFQEVEGLVHILDEKEDAIITLNQSASFIWNQLSKPSSEKEIAEKLVSEYKIKFDKAIKDSKELIQKLEKQKLIVKI